MADCDAAWSAQPQTVFLPKFGNADKRTTTLYEQLGASGAVLVATIKSSGSLWICSAARTPTGPRLVCASKNGAGNKFSLAGQFLFIRQLQLTHGPAWRKVYNALVEYLVQKNISLGCEIVSANLGDHGESPLVDHVIINAVICKDTLLASSPWMLVELERRFGVLTAGFYIYRDASRFMQVFHKAQYERELAFSDLEPELNKADGVHRANYALWQGQLLEGFVCYCIPSASVTDERLAFLQALKPPTPPPAMPDVPDLLPSLASVDMEAEDACEQLEALVRTVVPVHVMRRIDGPATKALVDLVKTGCAADDATSSQFHAMLLALDELKIKHEVKPYSEAGGSPGVYQVCVHVLHDESFIKYATFRAANPERHLPELLRGNFWVVRTGPAVTSVPDPSAAVGPPQDTALLAGGPIPSSIWKFKLLSYMVRTFLFRNCGTALAKVGAGGLDKFNAQVDATLRLWGTPPGIAEDVRRELLAWGNHIAGMDVPGRVALVCGYLSSYHQFRADYVASPGSMGGVPLVDNKALHGILVVVTPTAAGRDIAIQLSQHLTGADAVVPPTTDPRQLSGYESRGVVMWAAVCDPGLLKMIKGGFKLAGVRQVVALVVDCSPHGIEACMSGQPYNDLRRMLGIAKNLVPSLLKEDIDTFVVNRHHEDPDGAGLAAPVDGAGAAAVSPPHAHAQDWLAWASTIDETPEWAQVVARVRSRKQLVLRPITVMVFLTMAGWGKNHLVDAMHALSPAGFEAAFGMPKAAMVELEKDKLNDTWWREVERAFASDSCALLVLNRNLPPNAWSGTAHELQLIARRTLRSITFAAIVPESPSNGAPTNFFSTEEAAVCLMSVQRRAAHPSKLDASSTECEAVLAMFYGCYKHPHGRDGIIDALRAQLTPNIVTVPWVDGAKLKAIPDTVRAVMHEVLHVDWTKATMEDKAALRQRARSTLETAATELAACRVPTTTTLAALASGFKAAMATAVALSDAPKALKSPTRVELSLDAKVVHALLDRIAAECGPSVPSRRTVAHVTLWHHSLGPCPPLVHTSVGKTRSVNVQGFAMDALCAALQVAAPLSANARPHVTVWVDDGVPTVYANALLARVHGEQVAPHVATVAAETIAKTNGGVPLVPVWFDLSHWPMSDRILTGTVVAVHA